MYLIAASKHGISSDQLHRTLTLKTAWFMSHRIREAMKTDGGPMMGSDGAMVEVDETLFCRKPGIPVKRGTGHLSRVMALIDRSLAALTPMSIRHRRGFANTGAHRL
jgi:hypothetical protein